MLPKKNPFHREKLLFLAPADILPNPAQPRHCFDEAQLDSLADSIRQHGILQPLAVRRQGSGYELIAGERRLRAALRLGLSSVPCVLSEASDHRSRTLALVENLQRQDLHFLEEATAIAELIAAAQLSQEQAARQLGYSQSAVANKLRLLRLSPACCALLREGQLTERHARALLRLEDEAQRQQILRRCIRQELTVQQTEALIETLLHENRTRASKAPTYIIKDVRLFLNSLHRHMALMKNAGVGAQMQQQESAEEILLTIRIPKHRSAC